MAESLLLRESAAKVRPAQGPVFIQVSKIPGGDFDER
jgi:hypothetical protein